MSPTEKQRSKNNIDKSSSIPDRSYLGRLYPVPTNKKIETPSSAVEVDSTDNGEPINIILVLRLAAWLTLPVLIIISVTRIALSLTTLEYYQIPLTALVGLVFVFILFIIRSKLYDEIEKHSTDLSPNLPYLIFFLVFIPGLKLLEDHLLTGNILLVFLSGITLSILTASTIIIVTISKLNAKKKIYILGALVLVTYCVMLHNQLT